jgi:hypothetical protein
MPALSRHRIRCAALVMEQGRVLLVEHVELIQG